MVYKKIAKFALMFSISASPILVMPNNSFAEVTKEDAQTKVLQQSSTSQTTTQPKQTNTNTITKNEQTSSLADAIIKTGEKYLGTPYKFGAASGQTSTFDCSSFVQYVYKQHGISLPRNSRQQSTVGTTVSKSALQKGDLMFFRTSSSGSSIGHVAIYVGDNKILHTYGSGGVKYDNLSKSWLTEGYVTSKRVLKAEGPTNPTDPTEPTEPTEPTDPGGNESTTTADAILKTGEKYLGTPYQYGAQSGQTNTFDCSSFVQYVYKQHGISLPRNSRQQSTVGTTVTKSALQKGDLMFFRTSSSGSSIGHVAIYAGDNKVLHTWGSGGVKYESIKGWLTSGYVTAKRVIK